MTGRLFSGKGPLTQYLKNQAGQATVEKLSTDFRLNSDGKKIAGDYTLSSSTVQLDEIQEEIRKKWTGMH